MCRYNEWNIVIKICDINLFYNGDVFRFCYILLLEYVIEIYKKKFINFIDLFFFCLDLDVLMYEW